MAKTLVFVGGGHAHLTALLNLNDYVRKGYSVKLVSPVNYHYYSGMGPGMLSGIYSPNQVRFNIKKIAVDRGAEFVKAGVKSIDPHKRELLLDTGQTVAYDVVSFNVGSSIPLDSIGDGKDVVTVKPVINLVKAKSIILEKIKESDFRVLIIGGGAAGVELAGNVWRLVNDNGKSASITLVAGNKLLPSMPDRARAIALKSFKNRNIQVIEGHYLDRLGKGQAVLSNGASLPYDLAFASMGVRPPSIFKDSGLPVTPDGGLIVNEYLQSTQFPEIFGGGDCISFEKRKLDKVGVYAVRQNPILYGNLMAALERGPMEKFIPQQHYMLIFNLGDNTGIFVRNPWVWSGRIAFLLKDYVDKKFMTKFQVSGERLEDGEIIE